MTTVMKRHSLIEWHKIANIFKYIKFTMKMEDDGKLAFLDLLAKIKASVTLETPADRKKNRRTKTKLSQQSLKQRQKFVHTNPMHERKKTKFIAAHRNWENKIFHGNGYPTNFMRRTEQGNWSMRTARTKNLLWHTTKTDQELLKDWSGPKES